MPKENRKRGKKRRREDEKTATDDPQESVPELDNPKPSWIVPAPKELPESNVDAPFGYVDADVKAYFRTVDVQLRQWQDNEVEYDHENANSSEERRMFFTAALTEMSGKERQLCTDPECSIILERMIYSMDDFIQRVFADSLAGSYAKLLTNRFASHVCQTLFNLAASTVSREVRNIYPELPESSDRGELLTLTQLVLNACEELLPITTSLIMDSFASHVIRALLLLLCPNLSSSNSSTNKAQSILRSRKSAVWKARQGPLKSVFGADQSGRDDPSGNNVPEEFARTACKFVQNLRKELSQNEVRALAANKVASPVLQILLEIESDQNMAATPDSLMDRIMVGIITACNEHPITPPAPSDFIVTLLRDPTSSHLLEIVAKSAPNDAFAILWSTYFRGKLSRLANHPVANFVVARALERITEEQLGEVCTELDGTWQKIIKSSRTGVLRAAIDRAAALRSHENDVVDATLSAFNLKNTGDHNFLLPCALHLMTLQEYKLLLSSRKHPTDESEEKNQDKTDNNVATEVKIQGMILLQSLLRLEDPHNHIVIDSIKSLSPDELLNLARNPTSSRVLDVYLESSAVPFKAKRQLVASLIGHFHLLVDDRIGSRVADRCWAFADPYLKERIGKSLIPHETFLAASFYGKFFARNLNLYLLQRRPEEWRRLQAEKKNAAAPSSPVRAIQEHDLASDGSGPSHRRKRRGSNRPEDEIDAVFNSKLGKRVKKGHIIDAIAGEGDRQSHSSTRQNRDPGLQVVLSAIRAAPKGEKNGRKSRL